MPALNTQIMLATARLRFSGFRIKLPTVVGINPPTFHIAPIPPRPQPWGPRPVMIGRHREPPQLGTALNCPPALFVHASNNLQDVEMQRVCSDKMDTYLSRLCDAIGLAHYTWRLQARLVQVAVNGPVASGGSLQAGSFGAEIRARAPRDDAWQSTRSDAIAAAIGICWELWQRSVSVPNLPWYPTFAAFPGPAAPPTPNVPTPLVMLQNAALMSGSRLKSQMLAAYTGDHEWHSELFDAVASGLERAFQLWLSCQLVANVMGTGPVPQFAPPEVPVGKVLGGTANQFPGAW
jgi:hypothetical protein